MVLLGVVFAEVQLHARVVAFLKLVLQLGPVVVEILIEVGERLVSLIACGLASSQNDSACRLEVETLVVSVAREGHKD